MKAILREFGTLSLTRLKKRKKEGKEDMKKRGPSEAPLLGVWTVWSPGALGAEAKGQGQAKMTSGAKRLGPCNLTTFKIFDDK